MNTPLPLAVLAGVRGSARKEFAGVHEREEAKFTRFVEEHSRFVFRVAYAVLHNSHDAEDAMQETFLKLYRNGAWRDVSDARAFLARVTWRMAVDRLPPAAANN